MGRKNEKTMQTEYDRVKALQNMVVCMDRNDGDSLANATNDARTILQRHGRIT